jgi:uncharacterized protein GlcG (DUF336 family)
MSQDAATRALTRESTTLTCNAARELIGAAIDAAGELGHAMTIAVHDNAGELLGFARMDGAPPLTVRLAQDKSYTAAAYGVPTHQWHEFIKDDEPLKLGIVHTPRLVIFGGGYPLVLGGQLVGGIGIAGGHYSDDMKVAEAALRSLDFDVPGQ